MDLTYTEEQIAELIAEPKVANLDFDSMLALSPFGIHLTGNFQATGESGNKFRVIIRQSTVDLLSFSVILGVFPSENSKSLFHLRRYNGKHAHKNALEKTRFFDFHIHYATERYQLLGKEVEAFAEQTDRYDNLRNALTCLLTDAQFEYKDKGQLSLFDSI